MTTATLPRYFTDRRTVLCEMLGCPTEGHLASENPATGELVEGHMIPSRNWTNEQANAYEADFAKTRGQTTPEALPAERKNRGGGEPQPVDPETARRHAEAVAYVRDYHGTWGLPLDIRASEKWGTKYLRLSERQVDALLAGKARDAERAAGAASIPGYAEAVTTAAGWAGRGGFCGSMYEKVAAGQTLTANMVAAILRSAPPARPLVETGDEFNRRWAEHKNEYARLERVQEEAAFMGDPDMRGSRLETAWTVRRGEARQRITEDGMYRMADGTIVKVQQAVNGSGHLYGKRLVAEGAKGTFAYEPGLINRLSPADRMTVEEAAEFGKLYGFCCVCGRTLTDENSIAAGIGPVCAANV